MLPMDAGTWWVLLASCDRDFGENPPWGRREEKRKPVQPDLWELHPVKLLKLSERREGLECAGKRLKVAAQGEGFGEV